MITFHVIFMLHTMIDSCHLIILVYVIIGGFSCGKAAKTPLVLCHMVNGPDCSEYHCDGKSKLIRLYASLRLPKWEIVGFYPIIIGLTHV